MSGKCSPGRRGAAARRSARSSVAGVTHRFSGAAADAYDAGRAPYLPEVVAALDLSAPPSRVLDLAAGTGLLSRALMQAGHEVVAVEPDLDMAGRQPQGVERHAASAEATGLQATSVEAVVVGDAWHWFDAGAAAEEVHRVLRPRGRLAIVWRFSEPEERPAELGAFQALLDEARALHVRLPEDRGRGALEAHPGFTPLVHRRVPFVHHTDPARLLAEAASASFVNALEEREAFMAELAASLEGVGLLDVPYVADIWRTTRRR